MNLREIHFQTEITIILFFTVDLIRFGKFTTECLELLEELASRLLNSLVSFNLICFLLH